MAKYSTTVEYNIQTRLDASGLTQLQTQLRQCETELNKMRGEDLISQSQLNAAQNRLRTYREALSQSFNALTKTMDVNQFNQILTNRGTSIQRMASDLNSLGVTGQRTFNGMISTLGRLDTGLKTTSKTTDKIFNTLGNTVRWGLIASAFQEVMNAAHNAVAYMQDLDRSLTDIMLVSDYTKDDMREFAQYANEAAAALGNTTVAYTDAAMIYAQQGYNLEDQKQLADMTLKVANVTGQETSEVSEQMTSIINGYGLAVDDLGASMDQIAKIANISAADVEELAVASSRVAATASALGVDQSQLYSQIGTIVSVTREAPEVVGNALKTIYARFGDLKMGETLEDGVDLGTFSGTLEKLGVQVLDTNGQMRDMGSIIEDLMQKWNTFDRATQQSAAVTLAGKFQYNRLMTLMNNQDMYYDYLEEAENNSLGTLDEMESEYLDSLAGKSATLQATVEGLLSSLFDQSKFTPVIGFFTDLIGLVDNLVKGIGGGIPVLTAFSGILLRTFSQNIGNMISKNLTSRRAGQLAQKSSQAALSSLQRLGGNESISAEQDRYRDFAQFGQTNSARLNLDEVKQYNGMLEQGRQKLDALATAESKHQANIDATNIKIAALNATMGEQQQKEALLSNTNRFAPFNLDLENINTSAINTQLKGTTDNLQTLMTMLTEVESETADATLRTTQYSDILNMLKTEASSLSNVFGDQLITMLNNFELECGDAGIDAQRLGDIITQIQTRIAEARAAGGYNTATQMDTGQSTVDAARFANNAQQQEEEAWMQSRVESNQYADIMNVVGAVAQLTFAWQSFQSLGSLWGNSDVELGEKISQTVLSLTMSVPMIVSAFLQLKQANISTLFGEWSRTLANFSQNQLGKFQQGLGRARQAMEASATTSRAAALGFGIMGTAASAASGMVKALGIALEFLTTGPGIALMAALTIIPMVLQGIESAHQAQVTAANDAAQKAQSAADSAIESTKNWNELYQTWEETHVASTEFRTAAEEISDSLNIIGGDALIAAGKFDELNNEISKIKDEKLNENINAQQQVIDVNRQDMMGTLTNGSLASDVYRAASQHGATAEAREAFGWNAETQTIDNLSYEESYVGIKKLVADLREEQQELQNTSDRTQEQDDRLEELKEAISAVNQELGNNEEWGAIEEAEASLSASVAQTSRFQEQLKQAQTGQEIYDTFANSDNEYMATYWKGLQTAAERYRFAVQYVTDETQKMALTTQYAYESLSEKISDPTQLEKAFNTIKGYYNSPDEMLQFIGTLDENATLDEINNAIHDFNMKKFDKLLFDVDLNTDELKEAVDNRENLESLITSYQENGNFTTEETASLIAEHPEYLEYLTKVGDQYMLNERALTDWNNATDAQADALEELTTVDYSALKEINNVLTQELDESAFSQIASDFGELDAAGAATSLRDLNQSFIDGDMSINDYANGLSNITQQIGELGNLTSFDSENGITLGLDSDELAQLSDLLGSIGNSIAEAMSEATKSFELGQSSLKDYLGTLGELADVSADVSAEMKGLTKVGDRWTASQEDAADAVDEETQRQVDQINALEDSADEVQDLNKVWGVFTDQGKDLSDWFGDFGTEIDTSAIEASGQHYYDVLNNLASASAEFFAAHKDEAIAFADQLIQTGAVTLEELKQYGIISEQQTMITANQLGLILATNASALQQLVVNDTQAASQLVRSMLGVTEQQVAIASSGIADMLDGLAGVLNSFSVDILATVSQDDSLGSEVGGEYGVIDSTGIFGSVAQAVVGSVKIGGKIPGFRIGIKSENASFNHESESYKTGLSQLASGSSVMANAFGGNGASLDDFYNNPGGGGGVPASSFSPSSGRSSGSSGGGGGGGGSSPKSSGGSGGSGGSGSGNTYEPKTKELIEEEIDRYERVDTLLEDVENKFDEVSNEQDRLIGFDQADNMMEQIDLLQKQIVLHKEKLALQQQEAQELRNQLSSQYGIAFDAEGFISNYAEVHQRLTNEVNNLINQYNATADEAGQEALEQQIEAAEDRLDKFKDQYQRYDELFAGDLNETLKTLEDLEDQIEDLRIEALQTQIEAVENIKDLNETLIDFNLIFSGMEKDNPFRDMSSSAQKLAKYFDAGTGSAKEFYDTLISRTEQLMNTNNISESMRKWYQAQLEQMRTARQAAGSETMEAYGTGYLDMELTNLQAILEQLNQFEQTGISSIFGEDSADLYEVAQDVFESATSMMEDFEDEIEDLKDAILDAIDEIGEKMDERREQYENITDELEHQREIAELLRGDQNYDEINQLLQAQQNNYQSSISSLEDQLDILKELQSGLKEDSEEWKAVQEMIVDTQEQLNDLVEESLENLREQYENTVSDIGDRWVKSALGTDLDWMEEQWELINRNADYYLDDVNAAYETQKLENKYLDLLDNAGDLHSQQLITEQMSQQLGYLREKTKLSEYDVKYAEMQIELLQKRIALEEAQRSKSQLKLRRDSQGNYNYVYTADTEATKSAEEDYLDAQNNAYNLSKDQMREAQEQSMSALADARKLLDDIWNDANLSLEEKKQRTQTIIDSLKEYLEGTSEQLATSQANMAQSFFGFQDFLSELNAERLQEAYEQMIQGNTDAMDQIDDRWDTSITDWLYNLDEFNGNTDAMFRELVSNAENYQEQTDSIADLVEQNFNSVADAVNKAKDATDSLAASNNDFINQLKNDAGVIQDYELVMQSYADKIRDAENAMRAYQSQVNSLQQQVVAKEQENANLSSQVQQLQDQINYNYNPGISNGGGGGGGTNEIRVGNRFGFHGLYFHDSWGSRPAGSIHADEPGAVFIRPESNTQFGGNQSFTGDFSVSIGSAVDGYTQLGWVRPDQLFDTGGYTGEWSDGDPEAKNGKIAWLHSKEMVLNEDDTRNILVAVEAVRDMTASIKNGALSGLASSFLNNTGVIQPQVENVDQTVSITAEFPNATDANDIREAILGLSEQAFQYAHRTR